MAIERVRAYLEQYGAADRVLEFGVSSATVELAAKALGCEPGRIAKSLSFGVGEGYIVIVTAGDCKIDNAKYKAKFHAKARMLTPPEVEEHIGHAVGGVCPFGVNDGVAVYLDESLRRFGTVFPACGSSNSAIELTVAELERYSRCAEWVDVCKGLDNSASCGDTSVRPHFYPHNERRHPIPGANKNMAVHPFPFISVISADTCSLFCIFTTFAEVIFNIDYL